MDPPEKSATPTWIEFLVVTTGAVWCGAIGFFLGFLLADGMGWIQMQRLGNVADAPPPDVAQWLAWAVPCGLGLAAAWVGGKVGKLLVRRIGEVGRGGEE